MTDEIIAYAKAFNKPVYLAGDLNEQLGKGYALPKFFDNGFVLLNDPTTLTFRSTNPTSLLDMIFCYKNGSTSNNIVSRGIPLFPRKDLSKCSDHLPYFVTIKM